jgi:hypothetical protein
MDLMALIIVVVETGLEFDSIFFFFRRLKPIGVNLSGFNHLHFPQLTWTVLDYFEC